MKKTIVKLIAVLALCFMVGAVLVACKAEAGPQGEKGDKGDKGDASVVTIVEIEGVKYWAIDGESTGVKAEGVDGNDAVVAECEHENVKSHVLTEHKYDGAVATIGKTLNVCDDCGNAEIDLVDHTFTPAVTAPTCVANGYTTYSCACGYSYVDGDEETEAGYVAATGHLAAVAFDAANIDATVWTEVESEACYCVTDDVYEAACKYEGCTVKVTASVGSADHVYVEWDENLTEEENVANGWQLAEDVTGDVICIKGKTYVQKCQVCGDDADKEAHKECQKIHVIAAPGHTYAEGDVANCTHDVVCTVAGCGHIKEGEAAKGHNVDGTLITVTTQPTATDAGAATIKCTDCDYVENVVLPALGAGATDFEANYTRTTVPTGASCVDADYEYAFVHNYINERTNAAATATIKFTTDANLEHEGAPEGYAPDFSDWEAKGGFISELNGKRYYMYECTECGRVVVVKVEDIPATQP